jgi:acetylornithine deacetylase/succinyl-diaminopimelate desuccinylase-like protein
MANYDAIDQYLEQHFFRSIDELCRLCAQPSVSATGEGVEQCAGKVAEMLAKRGFAVELMQTGGAPAVYAERKGRKNKTLLFYNHYDVQPVEPLDLWVTPPYEPDVREGKLYGRGVDDDKGPLVSRLFAIDAILNSEGELPCNVKFLIEGEEETGSVHLRRLVEENIEKLAADVCVWEGGGVNEQEEFVQYLGLRGICYVELSVETANQDVHSGLGGSIFPNAAWRLVWALNSLKNENETILIPGFYDNVLPPSERDAALMASLPDMAEEYLRRYALKGFLKGIKGGSELRIEEVFRPTCTICGLTAGYQGPGSKTVLPARASAKVDFRLVPNQTPQEVLEKLRQHLDAQGFSDVAIEFMGGEGPGRTEPGNAFVQLAIWLAEEVYGKPAQVIPMAGGSGPNAIFIEKLGLPVVMAGVGYPEAQIHAPNENIRLDLYMKGAKYITRILMEYAGE